MKRYFASGLFAMLFSAAGIAHGQASGEAAYGLEIGQAPLFQISAQYQATHANAPPGQCGCFWMQGGGVQVNLSIRPAWSAMADVYIGRSGQINGTDEQINIFNYMVGPRYTLRRASRYTPYAHALAGISHVTSNYVVYSANNNNAAAELGLGVEFYLTPKISAVPAEGDWVFSHALNGVNTHQNNSRIGFGVVYRLGPH